MTPERKEIATPGYYEDLSMKDYLADPCPEPALSSGIVQTLMTGSPRLARWEHPRFGRNGSEDTPRGDIGSAVHSLSLGGAPVVFAPVEFEDWKKKAAQEFRDDARDKGKIPLLDRQQFGVMMAADSAKQALLEYGPGKPEQSMIFQFDGVWGRGRADWLTDDGQYDIDIKTVERAEATEWARRVVQAGGLDFQASLRSLGHEALTTRRRKHLWLLVEIEGVYDTRYAEPDAKMMDLAEAGCHHAAKIWRKCLDSKIFPGLPRTIHRVESRAWAEVEHANRVALTNSIMGWGEQ